MPHLWPTYQALSEEEKEANREARRLAKEPIIAARLKEKERKQAEASKKRADKKNEVTAEKRRKFIAENRRCPLKPIKDTESYSETLYEKQRVLYRKLSVVPYEDYEGYEQPLFDVISNAQVGDIADSVLLDDASLTDANSVDTHFKLLNCIWLCHRRAVYESKCGPFRREKHYEEHGKMPGESCERDEEEFDNDAEELLAFANKCVAQLNKTSALIIANWEVEGIKLKYFDASVEMDDKKLLYEADMRRENKERVQVIREMLHTDMGI